jgi:hypothetical protein
VYVQQQCVALALEVDQSTVMVDVEGAVEAAAAAAAMAVYI